MLCSLFAIVRAVKISRNLVKAVKKKGICAHKECAQINKRCFMKWTRGKKCFDSFRFFFSLSREHGSFSFIWWRFFGYTSRWPEVSWSNHDDDGDTKVTNLTIVYTLLGHFSFRYILEPFSSHQRCKVGFCAVLWTINAWLQIFIFFSCSPNCWYQFYSGMARIHFASILTWIKLEIDGNPKSHVQTSL